MTDELTQALDVCLQALAQGETLDAALRRYPALAAELRPLLETAQAAQMPHPRPQPAQQAAHRAKFFSRAATYRVAARPHSLSFLAQLWATLRGKNSEDSMQTMTLAVRAVLVAGVFIFGVTVGTYGMASVSAASLPGDPLYGIKRSLEDAQLFFTPPTERPLLEEQFAERRATEVQAVATQGRTAEIEFTGRLEAPLADGWQVAGLQVVVNAQTTILGDLTVGRMVAVKGQTQADGSVLALRLQVEDTPAATSTPAEAETEHPEASATPRPGGTTPAATTQPTETRRPTETARPRDDGTHTPRPTGTEVEHATETLEPTETEPEHTAEPSETPEDNDHGTPEPTRTDKPDDNNNPPEPTRTPKPDDD